MSSSATWVHWSLWKPIHIARILKTKIQVAIYRSKQVPQLAFLKRLVDIVTPLADAAAMINPMGINATTVAKYDTETRRISILLMIQRYYRLRVLPRTRLTMFVQPCYSDFWRVALWFCDTDQSDRFGCSCQRYWFLWADRIKYGCAVIKVVNFLGKGKWILWTRSAWIIWWRNCETSCAIGSSMKQLKHICNSTVTSKGCEILEMTQSITWKP